MIQQTITVRIRGEDIAAPALVTDQYSLVRTGRWLRTAQLFDEELVETIHFPKITDALALIKDGKFGADLLTYAKPLDGDMPQLEYKHVMDNLAVVSTSSYDAWWTGLPQEARKNMRLAAKRGVVVRPTTFDEILISGIKAIYDESPVRQGRRFWHYQKSLDRVRMLNATYLDRSAFIGAYVGEELVGFVKYIRVNRTAVLVQIIAKESHRDKKPVNALLQQTVELCHRQRLETLTYGKFDYGVNQNSSLTEFKRRNGFRRFDFPRYYVPLTGMGRLALALGIHTGWHSLVPSSVRTQLHRVRGRAVQILGIPTSRGAR